MCVGLLIRARKITQISFAFYFCVHTQSRTFCVSKLRKSQAKPWESQWANDRQKHKPNEFFVDETGEEREKTKRNKWKRQLNEFDVHTLLNHYLSLSTYMEPKHLQYGFFLSFLDFHSKHVLASGGISLEFISYSIGMKAWIPFKILDISYACRLCIPIYIYRRHLNKQTQQTNGLKEENVFKVLFSFIRFDIAIAFERVLNDYTFCTGWARHCG